MATGEETPLEPSAVVDVKAFVPAKSLDVAKQFYVDLGFTLNWSDEGIAEFQIGAFRFLLQRFYVKEHAGHHGKTSRHAALGAACAVLERPNRRSLAYRR